MDMLINAKEAQLITKQFNLLIEKNDIAAQIHKKILAACVRGQQHVSINDIDIKPVVGDLMKDGFRVIYQPDLSHGIWIINWQ